MSVRFIVLVVFTLLIGGITLDIILLGEKSDQFQEFNSLKVGEIICIIDFTGKEIDYLYVVENRKDGEKLQIQFLLKRRFITNEDKPWALYSELGRFFKREKYHFSKDNDRQIRKLFQMKNR